MIIHQRMNVKEVTQSDKATENLVRESFFQHLLVHCFGFMGHNFTVWFNLIILISRKSSDKAGVRYLPMQHKPADRVSN